MASVSPTTVPMDGHVGSATAVAASPSSPLSTAPIPVTFQLLLQGSRKACARLPMRVNLRPHDDTESIVTTVKNFYGLYSNKCITFEDEEGNTLIARYENFRNNMQVFVRVVNRLDSHAGSPTQRIDPEMPRPESRRSPSPTGARDDRSASASTSGKSGKSDKNDRSRPLAKRLATADVSSESANGYSSGDNASTSSGRPKEQIGNTEISVDNIVEGRRRKRAKFESSQLPLFAPPQMPASTSNPSVSPVRRAEQWPPLPSAHNPQNPFTLAQLPQSPKGLNSTYSALYSTPGPDERRGRGSAAFGGVGSASDVLPTPDPTVASCMSEEDKDVAIQLMRLGDLSGISQGRTSASTLDDTFSRNADAASSAGVTSDVSDSEDDPSLPARRQKIDRAGVASDIYPTTEGHFVSVEGVEAGTGGGAADRVNDNAQAKLVKKKAGAKPKLPGAPRLKPANKIAKPPRAPGAKVKKAASGVIEGPMSPPSLPPSRKQSVVSGLAILPPPADDGSVDLSTKPRCQRCRKSKKGCDRQRPCGRCKDAGLSAEDCVSEDENNGRKGRFGRHMGVPIKKDDVLPIATGLPTPIAAAPAADVVGMAFPTAVQDKSKKRKR